MGTHWNRPMREYHRPVLLCDECGLPITGESRMVRSALYHVGCGPHGPVSPELQARIDRRKPEWVRRAEASALVTKDYTNG